MGNLAARATGTCNLLMSAAAAAATTPFQPPARDRNWLQMTPETELGDNMHPPRNNNTNILHSLYKIIKTIKYK
jgi:hypothetical protein